MLWLLKSGAGAAATGIVAESKVAGIIYSRILIGQGKDRRGAKLHEGDFDKEVHLRDEPKG